MGGRTGAALLLSGLLLSVVAACGSRGPVQPVAPLRTEPVSTDQGERFGRLFCGVLNHVSTKWGFCERYFSPSGTPAPVEATIRLPYRVLVVPGIFGQCVERLARPFEDARKHLLASHGVEVEYVSVAALGSAAHNASQIATYLQSQMNGGDTRQYIVFGYSKGTSDLIEAIVSHDVARESIKAVVSIAGSVLGSRLAPDLPRDLVAWLRNRRLGPCDIGDGGAVADLTRASRARALSDRPLPSPRDLPTYSIPAVATTHETSAILQTGWKQLSAYSVEQDSQMVHEDAIIPGSLYLGHARADHWAVALPFEDVTAAQSNQAGLIQRLVDRNHYPRVALFEAALRFVVSDLETRQRAPNRTSPLPDGDGAGPSPARHGSNRE